VEKILQRNPKTINENSTVFEAVEIMTKNRLYGLLVVNDAGSCVGIISERSIIRRFILRNLPAKDVLVKSVMRNPVPRASPDDDVKDVAEFLASNGLSRCVVFDKDDRVLGIVTITDLSRYLSVESTFNVLFSHKNKEYKMKCKKCLVGFMEPVYNSRNEITVFKCNNKDCNNVE
jgi:CBS domain-containing protein